MSSNEQSGPSLKQFNSSNNNNIDQTQIHNQPKVINQNQLTNKLNFIMQLNPQLSSRSRFKLTEGNISLLHDNPLNTSTSKMQFSIPKSKRWSEQKLTSNEKSKFYDLPGIKNNRSTSFGYGNKVDLSKSNVKTPSPMNYTINGEFDCLRDNKRVGITFGAGREVVKNVNTYGIKPFKVPGPQDYSPNKSTIELNQPKYSMSSRHSDPSQKWPKVIPGPGMYNTIELVKNNDHLTLSKFQSSPAISFSKNKRLSDYEQRMRITRVPGPGEYKVDNMLNTTTRFGLDSGRRFGRSEREGIAGKTISPGPGAYRCFSEFIY